MTITAQPANLNAAYRPIMFRATAPGTLQPVLFQFSNYGGLDLIFIGPPKPTINPGDVLMITNSNGQNGSYTVQTATDHGTYISVTVPSDTASIGGFTGNLSINGVLQNATQPPPVAYCDVYFGGIYFKSFSSTAPLASGEFQFDISDAARQYLASNISANGGTGIAENDGSLVSCFCRFRDSYTDSNGFIVPAPSIPLQATSSQVAVPGGGTQSNTIFIVNATLQHENNPDLATHLNAYKIGNWDSGAYPMSHRTANYGMYYQDSDYFPICNVGTRIVTGIRLNYRPIGSNVYQQIVSIPCTAVTAAAFNLSMGIVGTAYARTLQLQGTLPITLTNAVHPQWLSISINGNVVSFTGTPTSADVTANTAVSFTVSNACGSVSPATNIMVVSSCVGVGISSASVLPNAQAGAAYTYAFALSGTPIFQVSNIIAPGWMQINISGSDIVFGGTPTAQDVTGSTTVSFTLSNCAGADTLNYSQQIQVIAGSTATITPVSNNVAGYTRTQEFSIGDPITVGKSYYVQVYSHAVLVSAVSGDTGTTIASRLAAAVNATTANQWNDMGSAPATGTQGFPPTANSSGNLLTVTLDAAHQFGSGVI